MTSRLERFQSDTVVEIRNGSDRTEKLLESALERNIKQIETRFNDGIEQARKRITRWAIASLSLIIVIGSALALLIILSAGSVTN